MPETLLPDTHEAPEGNPKDTLTHASWSFTGDEDPA
jgi:hypothetical protein